MSGQKLWVYLLVLGLALVVGATLIRIGLGGPEDTWICSENGWVRHGDPSQAMPETGCVPTPAMEPTPRLIGGDQDENGCLIGAGYSWCEALGQCIRPWEQPCEITSEATESGQR